MACFTNRGAENRRRKLVHHMSRIGGLTGCAKLLGGRDAGWCRYRRNWRRDTLPGRLCSREAIADEGSRAVVDQLLRAHHLLVQNDNVIPGHDVIRFWWE